MEDELILYGTGAAVLGALAVVGLLCVAVLAVIV